MKHVVRSGRAHCPIIEQRDGFTQHRRAGAALTVEALGEFLKDGKLR